jgi:hypothetical protein
MDLEDVEDAVKIIDLKASQYIISRVNESN